MSKTGGSCVPCLPFCSRGGTDNTHGGVVGDDGINDTSASAVSRWAGFGQRIGATMLETARKAFMSASMTALQKPDGGVRGIATGTSSRRLVSKTHASSGRQWKRYALPSTSHCQHLRARAVFGHAIRAVTEADHHATVLSIDGVGAYDHVYRAAVMEKLHQVPSLQGLLPFVVPRTPNPQVTCGKTRMEAPHRRSRTRRTG